MADENGVVLYTTEPCGFCRQAKTLLQTRGVDYREVNLAKDPDGRADLVALTGQMTFPQIVVGRRSIGGFSPSAGGVVCAGCEAGSFPLGAEAHAFLVQAIARPLSEAPEAPDRALSQADRAIAETMEYHAHVRLRRVA